MLYYVDYVYMYAERDEKIDFHVKRIAQTKGSIKHMSNIYGSEMQSEEKL